MKRVPESDFHKVLVRSGEANTDIHITQIASILMAVTPCCWTIVCWRYEDNGWGCSLCNKLLDKPPSRNNQGESSIYIIEEPNLGVPIEKWIGFWINVEQEDLVVEVKI